MAKTVYIRDDDREVMGKNKPPSWPLVDYLGFLVRLHDDMDLVERAEREVDYQRYLAAKRDAIIGAAEIDLERATAIRQADAEPAPDMRYCSEHCRHIDGGLCHCTTVLDAYNETRFVLKCDVGTVTSRVRDEHCPYSMEDFQHWQRCADWDAAENARLDKVEKEND